MNHALIQILLLNVVLTISEPGPTNPYYPIGTYTGSRYREIYAYEHLLYDNPILITMTKDICYYYNLVFISVLGKIKCINTTSSIISIVNVNSNKGYLDGDINHAMFSSSISIAFFQSNTSESKRLASRKVFAISSDSQPCIYADNSNYTSCLMADVNNETIIPSKQFIFVDLYNSSLRVNETIGDKMLYIADTDNHCIRAINLEISIQLTRTR